MIESRHEFIPEKNIVFVERKGTFVAGDFFATVLSIVGEEGYRNGMNFLVDARGMDYTPASESNIQMFKSNWTVIENIIGVTKIATIQKNPANMETSLLSSKIFSSEIILRSSFYEIADALNWLELSENLNFAGQSFIGIDIV